MVWSDPEDVETWAISPRGAGWLFGAKVTNEVREKKKLIKNVKKTEGHITHYRSILQCLINLFDRPATKIYQLSTSIVIHTIIHFLF